jgi:[NiFe] hydrogenase assembly HybE family chaperone
MSTEFDIKQWETKVDTYFNGVYENSMFDLPIVNHKLDVAVISFSQLKLGRYLGVLVTPWFINMVFKLVDETGEDLHKTIFTQKIGETVQLKFPAGKYEFIVNYDDALGYFYSCALVSDMHTLNTQEDALVLANECKRLLFDGTMSEPVDEQPLTTSTYNNEQQTMQSSEVVDAQTLRTQNEGKTESEETKEDKSIENTNYSRRSLFGLKSGSKEV